MAWKFPERRYKAINAQDVDDFNETTYAMVESGNLGEHNFSPSPWGTTDANRITYMARDVGLHTEITSAYAVAAYALRGSHGWVVVATKTITCLEASLRVSARYNIDDVLPGGTGVSTSAAIRINGVRDYDSTTPMTGGNASRNVFAQAGVPAGTHTIELVVKSDNNAQNNVQRATISILVQEK